MKKKKIKAFYILFICTFDNLGYIQENRLTNVAVQ